MKDIRPKVADGQDLEPTAFVRRLSGLDSAGFVLKREIELQEQAPRLLDEDLDFTSFVQKAKSPYAQQALTTEEDSDSIITVEQPVGTEPSDSTAEIVIADEMPAATESGEPSDETGEEEPFVIADSTEIDSHGYPVRKYRPRFTPDLVTGGLGYDTFFGLRGQSFFVISDYLGDHQIYISTDLINTIDQSNVQVYYRYTAKRIDYGFGLFHSKYYYLNFDDQLFSDRTYGFRANASRPFSKFTRLQLDASMVFIDRRFVDPDQNGVFDDRSNRITLGVLSLVHDASIWGMTGPASGRRYRVSLEMAPDALSKGIAYRAIIADFRQYTRLGRRYSLALRLAGGASGGDQAKRFYLGGVSNWIGSTVNRSDVYDVEGLYFSQLITPFRGYDYYELAGSKFALMNAEFRFPFVDYLALRFPIPIVLAQVGGSVFADVGSVWDDSDKFRGTSTAGGFHLEDIRAAFGYGVRANLGFILLRFDQAWRTDLKEVADKPKYFFSLGADF